MNSRCMLFVLCSSVWRRASSFVALLTSCIVLLLASRAQAALPMPGPKPAQQCINVYDKDLEIGDQHFAVITISAGVPNCGLRKAYRMFPALGEGGKPLSENEWLRSVYAANQGKNSPVHRGCAETVNHQPPLDATEEEKKICPDSMVNYFGIESSGGRRYIHIPTTRMYTYFEQQALAASKACSVLGRIPNPTDQVKKALEDCAKSQVKGENQKPILPPVEVDKSEEPAEDVTTVRSLLAIAKLQMASLKIQVTHLKYDLQAALVSRNFFANSFTLSTVCLGLTMIGGASLVRKNRRLKKQVSEQAEELARAQAEASTAVETAQVSAARAEQASSELETLKMKQGLDTADAGALEPTIAKLRKELADKQDELAAQINLSAKNLADELAAKEKSYMEISRRHHEEKDRARQEFEKTIAELRDKLAKCEQELRTAQATTPPTETPPPTTETTSPPTTVTPARAVSCPTAQPSYRKNTLDFQPVSAEQVEIVVLRKGLYHIIDSRSAKESKVLEGVEADVLVARAIELVSQDQTSIAVSSRAGFEVSALDDLDNFELSSYVLSIFKEAEHRLLTKGERLEIFLQATDDLRAAWRFLKSTRLVLSTALDKLVGDRDKDFFLDDAVVLAQILGISQGPQPVREVRSGIKDTMVPPDKIPVPGDPQGEPGAA